MDKNKSGLRSMSILKYLQAGNEVEEKLPWNLTSVPVTWREF